MQGVSRHCHYLQRFKPCATWLHGSELARGDRTPSAVQLPNFSFSAGNSRSGLNGVAVKRIPVALAIALPIAAATGLYGLSLIDFAPIGPIVSQVSAKWTSVRGTSAKFGT